MDSDNPAGAENQQERLIRIGWVVGFVDGEGCFSIGFVKQPDRAGRRGLKRYIVSARDELMEVVIPFFREHPLRSSKRHDFATISKPSRGVWGSVQAAGT